MNLLNLSRSAGAMPRRTGFCARKVCSHAEQRGGKTLYLSQEYRSAVSVTLEAIVDGMESLRQETMRPKDQVLLWIYAIEWVAVTGVFLTTSSLL